MTEREKLCHTRSTYTRERHYIAVKLGLLCDAALSFFNCMVHCHVLGTPHYTTYSTNQSDYWIRCAVFNRAMTIKRGMKQLTDYMIHYLLFNKYYLKEKLLKTDVWQYWFPIKPDCVRKFRHYRCAESSKRHRGRSSFFRSTCLAQNRLFHARMTNRFRRFPLAKHVFIRDARWAIIS